MHVICTHGKHACIGWKFQFTCNHMSVCAVKMYNS